MRSCSLELQKKPSSWIAGLQKAPVTYSLIGGCLAGYAIQYRFGSKIVMRGALQASRVMRGEVWRLVSSLFLHGSLLHLGYNVIALHHLGSSIERKIGRIGVLVTTLTAVVFDLLAKMTFGNPHMISIGISGVVFGFEGVQVVNESESGHVADIAKRCFQHIISRGPELLLLHALGIRIDHLAHLAGFVAGLVTGRIFQK